MPRTSRRRARLAVAIAALMTAALVTVAPAFERDEPLGPPVDAAATGEWRALAPAGLQRTEVAAARVGRSIYVVGGFEKRSGLTSRALERYDIRTNRWRRLRRMPIGVNHAVATAYRGKLYVHGGYTDRRNLSSATKRLYVYNPRTNRWRRLPDSRAPRAAHAFAALDGKLYAAGGRNETADLTSMEVYDVKRRRWRSGPSFPGPRRDHMTGVAAGGFFYALAGREGSALSNTAERYSPRSRRWQRLRPMRRARAGIASVAVSGGRVVVFGGEDFGTGKTIEQVELFDPRTKRWRMLPEMRTPRHGLGGAALGDRVYSIQGGPRPGFFFSDAIEFLDVR